jgi:hypothetical protein
MPNVRIDRHLAAVTPINRIIDSQPVFLGPGASQVIKIENMSVTDSGVGDTGNIAFPGGDDPTLYAQASGNLLNVLVYALSPGLILQVDEAPSFGSNFWMRSDQVLVTGGVPTFERAFRFIAPLAKVTLYNSDPSVTNVVHYMVRVSSM